MTEHLQIKQALIEQRVDQFTRDFLDELKKTISLLETLNIRIKGLEDDRLKAKNYVAGIMTASTILGGAVIFVLQHVTGWKL